MVFHFNIALLSLYFIYTPCFQLIRLAYLSCPAEIVTTVFKDSRGVFHDEHPDLINISTVIVATTEVKQYLLTVRQKGEAAYRSFVTDIIDGEEAETAFYSRLPKLQLKTFGSMTNSKKTSV